MAVAFVVTGYSTFPGCPENPTERLVLQLEQELRQRTASQMVAYALPSEVYVVNVDAAIYCDCKAKCSLADIP